MEVIKKGSIEPLIVAMRDRLENLEDLADVTNLRFDTKSPIGGAIETDVPVIVDEMNAICMITTTNVLYVADDDSYKLYIKFTNGAETPVLGPVRFRIQDD